MATTVVSDSPKCTERTKKTDQRELEVKARGKKEGDIELEEK